VADTDNNEVLDWAEFKRLVDIQSSTVYLQFRDKIRQLTYNLLFASLYSVVAHSVDLKIKRSEQRSATNASVLLG